MGPTARRPAGKSASLPCISLAQVPALSLWFSGTAAGPAMIGAAGLVVGVLAGGRG